MKRAGLIVNPKAGPGLAFPSRRQEIEDVLATHDFRVLVQETTAAANSARDLAARAAESCDLVLACGGDGTVHGVLQGVAGTATCLGVLPFGTANALARNLQLPTDPVKALQRLLEFTPRRIPLGVAETVNGPRWFTVMAGAGPDGRLVHEMKHTAKALVGRRAYYSEAARLFLTRRFPAFHVEYKLTGTQIWKSVPAVAIMASRIPDLGGLFQGLTTASRLHHPHLLVQVLSSPAHLAFPAWIVLGKTGLGRANPWLTTLEVDELRCTSIHDDREVHAQVDGEAVGPLPMTIRIETAALKMLMPAIG